MDLTEEGLKNMKDFLQQYNKFSEQCFNNCIVNLNNRNLTGEESSCADVCVSKLYNTNNRAIRTYMVEQPKFTQKKMEEAEAKAQETLDIMKSQGLDPETMSQEELTTAAIKIQADKAVAK
jgi:uncharacterized membrane protein